MRAGCEKKSPSVASLESSLEGWRVSEYPLVTLPTVNTAESKTAAQSSNARAIRTLGMKDEHLRIKAVGRVAEGVQPTVMVLVDTGAQVSLVRRGLVPWST